MGIHLGGRVAYIFAVKGDVPFEIDTSPEVDEHHGPALVHRQHEAVAFDAAFVAKCRAQGVAERDGHILHGVMLVHLEVAATQYVESKPAVMGELGEHVVKKFQSGVDDRCRGVAVEVDVYLDVGLGGVTLYGGRARREGLRLLTGHPAVVGQCFEQTAVFGRSAYGDAQSAGTMGHAGAVAHEHTL